MLRGVLRPPLRTKTSTGSLAATRHPLGRNVYLIGLDAQSAGLGLPSRPALRAGLQRRALPSLWGAPRGAWPPLRRAAFATANACPCTPGLLAWVWTTHPAPASGLAYGCGEVATLREAHRGKPPTPNRNRWGDCCHWRDGLQVIAGQCLGLLVASWRLPPPPAAPAGAGLPQGCALDACTPPASGRLPLHDTVYRVIPR